jgi:hypothetical protein
VSFSIPFYWLFMQHTLYQCIFDIVCPRQLINKFSTPSFFYFFFFRNIKYYWWRDCARRTNAREKPKNKVTTTNPHTHKNTKSPDPNKSTTLLHINSNKNAVKTEKMQTEKTQPAKQLQNLHWYNLLLLRHIR